MAVVKLTMYRPVDGLVTLDTFPLARMVGPAVPSKFTHARQAYTGAEPVALKPSRIRRGVMKLVLFVPAWASAVEAMVGAGDAALVQVVPFEVSTFPSVPGATKLTVDVPLPSKTLFAVSVVRPVPPLATATVPVTFAAVPLTLPTIVLLKVLTPEIVCVEDKSTKLEVSILSAASCAS
jgi:hypothetical protein